MVLNIWVNHNNNYCLRLDTSFTSHFVTRSSYTDDFDVRTEKDGVRPIRIDYHNYSMNVSNVRCFRHQIVMNINYFHINKTTFDINHQPIFVKDHSTVFDYDFFLNINNRHPFYLLQQDMERQLHHREENVDEKEEIRLSVLRIRLILERRTKKEDKILGGIRRGLRNVSIKLLDNRW